MIFNLLTDSLILLNNKWKEINLHFKDTTIFFFLGTTDFTRDPSGNPRQCECNLMMAIKID